MQSPNTDPGGKDFGNKTEKEYEIEFQQISEKYKCSLGERSGWCDGINANKCVYLLKTYQGSGCELSL